MENRRGIIAGFTILELTFVIAIVGVALAVIVGNCLNMVNRARFQSTVREMGSTAQAAIDSYNSSGNPNDPVNPQGQSWPTSGSSIGSPYMPQQVAQNPFKTDSYHLSAGNNMVSVYTVIPSGIPIDPTEGSFLTVSQVSGGQQVTITQSIPNEYSGRLSYDLQYIDKQ